MERIFRLSLGSRKDVYRKALVIIVVIDEAYHWLILVGVIALDLGEDTAWGDLLSLKAGFFEFASSAGLQRAKPPPVQMTVKSTSPLLPQLPH